MIPEDFSRDTGDRPRALEESYRRPGPMARCGNVRLAGPEPDMITAWCIPEMSGQLLLDHPGLRFDLWLFRRIDLHEKALDPESAEAARALDLIVRLDDSIRTRLLAVNYDFTGNPDLPSRLDRCGDMFDYTASIEAAWGDWGDLILGLPDDPEAAFAECRPDVATIAEGRPR